LITVLTLGIQVTESLRVSTNDVSNRPGALLFEVVPIECAAHEECKELASRQ